MNAAISRASIPGGGLTVIGADSETLVLPRAARGCAGIVTGLALATDGLPADIGEMPMGAVPTEGRGATSEAALPTVAGRGVAGVVEVGDDGLSLPKSEPNQLPTCLPASITQPILPAIQSMA